MSHKKANLFNFTLRHPADIEPWGMMGWFALSDGNYWLDLGAVNFYEYTGGLSEFGDTGSRFVDYQIARFVEDFSNLFERIPEPVPDDLYQIIKNTDGLSAFLNAVTDTMGDDDTEERSDEVIDRFHAVQQWITDRTLWSGHLTGGPSIWFFRNGNKISLVWNAEATLESGVKRWKAGKGNIELDYDYFVSEVADFKARLFTAMDRQIQIANTMDFDFLMADKERRLMEQIDRKSKFEQKMTFLNGTALYSKTDWDEVRRLCKELGV